MKAPLEEAIGAAAGELPPVLRQELLRSGGVRRYRGVMTRIWLRGGWQGRAAMLPLWLASLLDLLFPETGRDVPFDLEIEFQDLPDGRKAMVWRRQFHFPDRTRRFFDIITYEPEDAAVVDWLGRGLFVAAELRIRVSGGSLWMATGEVWLNLGRRRIVIPTLLRVNSSVRTSQEPDGALSVRATVHTPLLGQFFRYEGWFRPVEEGEAFSG